jgi:hypothetical protein
VQPGAPPEVHRLLMDENKQALATPSPSAQSAHTTLKFDKLMLALASSPSRRKAPMNSRLWNHAERGIVL